MTCALPRQGAEAGAEVEAEAGAGIEARTCTTNIYERPEAWVGVRLGRVHIGNN